MSQSDRSVAAWARSVLRAGLLLWMAGVLITPVVLAQEAGAAQPGAQNADLALVAVVIGIVVLIGIAVFVQILVLQRRFFSACKESGDLELYSQSPFGVPAGTIRSILAMTIVFASLAYVSLSMLGEFKFPEIMGGILGTVLGFYFGTRSSAGVARDKSVAAELQREKAVEAVNENKLTGLMNKAREGVGIAKILARVLPGSVGAKLGEVAVLADKSLAVAGGLAGAGQTGEALAEVGKAVSVLQQDSPVRTVLKSAMGSFGKVAGAVPALAIVAVVITIGARLTGAAYARWKSRVLDAPYTPELFPATVIDAAVAISIVRRAPVFTEAFATELQDGNRKYLRDLVRDALRDDARAALWARDDVAGRFEDLQQLEVGIEQVQRAAMTGEVLKDVAPEWVAPAGGSSQLFAAIDSINGDEDAQRDLDTIVLMASRLAGEGQPVERIFKDAIEEVKAGAAT